MTQFTSVEEMPLIVIESPIHRVMPCRNVPMPSVTMSEWMRKKITKKPFTIPVSRPIAECRENGHLDRQRRD